MYEARVNAESIRGARGAKFRSGTGPYEKKIHSIENRWLWRNVTSREGGDKKQQRSKGVPMANPKAQNLQN